MFSVITPTGGRPEAFALCEEWMRKQTVLQANPDWEWIVVDDGVPHTQTTMNQFVMRTVHSTKTGTQHLNMKLALLKARGEQIIIVEDDDYYGPKHLENVLQHLQKHPLVGERPSRYFNVRQRRFKQFNNDDHASFCQTAFRRELIPAVLEQCKTNAYIDVELWKRYGKSLGKLYDGDQVVGIKGMPGRIGVSNAHQCGGADWRGDIDLARLRQWIGADAERYRSYGGI